MNPDLGSAGAVGLYLAGALAGTIGTAGVALAALMWAGVL